MRMSGCEQETGTVQHCNAGKRGGRMRLVVGVGARWASSVSARQGRAVFAVCTAGTVPYRKYYTGNVQPRLGQTGCWCLCVSRNLGPATVRPKFRGVT